LPISIAEGFFRLTGDSGSSMFASDSMTDSGSELGWAIGTGASDCGSWIWGTGLAVSGGGFLCSIVVCYACLESFELTQPI